LALVAAGVVILTGTTKSLPSWRQSSAEGRGDQAVYGDA